MIKRMLFMAVLMALAGCAEIRVIRQSVGLYGAEAADQAVDTAVWTLCQGSSIGAINRRFVTESQKVAYRTICSGL